MRAVIGILSLGTELVEDLKVVLPDYEVRVYKSLDSIKSEEIVILSVDVDFFESADTAFYLSKIRKKLQNLPVILILRTSAVDSLDFEWFFDEFIVYPFRKGELSARIEKIMRDRGLLYDEDVITVGNLKINLKEYTVRLNNVIQNFTFKEFELLRLLVQNRGVVFSRKDLLSRIWGLDYIGGTRTVDVHIRRLRAKLGEEFNSVIETVRNVGYRVPSQ